MAHEMHRVFTRHDQSGVDAQDKSATHASKYWDHSIPRPDLWLQTFVLIFDKAPISMAISQDYYEGLGSLNLGVSGDQTQHLLWRIQNGELPEVLQPQVPADMVSPMLSCP